MGFSQWEVQSCSFSFRAPRLLLWSCVESVQRREGQTGCVQAWMCLSAQAPHPGVPWRALDSDSSLVQLWISSGDTEGTQGSSLEWSGGEMCPHHVQA